MKTFIVALLLIGMASGRLNAQGTVIIENDNNTLVYLETGPGTVVPVPAGPQFRAELLFAPDGTPANSFDVAATRVGVPVNFGPLPGRFSFGGRTIAGVTPPGGFGLFQVRAWEAAGGADYNSVVATGNPNFHAGKSIVVRIDTGNPTFPDVPGTLLGSGFQSFTLTPVPEPSAIALALLGVGVLLLRRRS